MQQLPAGLLTDPDHLAAVGSVAQLDEPGVDLIALLFYSRRCGAVAVAELQCVGTHKPDPRGPDPPSSAALVPCCQHRPDHANCLVLISMCTTTHALSRAHREELSLDAPQLGQLVDRLELAGAVSTKLARPSATANAAKEAWRPWVRFLLGLSLAELRSGCQAVGVAPGAMTKDAIMWCVLRALRSDSKAGRGGARSAADRLARHFDGRYLWLARPSRAALDLAHVHFFAVRCYHPEEAAGLLRIRFAHETFAGDYVRQLACP